MLALTNLSNADCDVENVLQNSADTLPTLLRVHELDGIEFMLCAPWDRVMFPPTYIQGRASHVLADMGGFLAR